MNTFTGDRNFDYYIMNSQAAKEEIIKILSSNSIISQKVVNKLNKLAVQLNDVDASEIKKMLDL